MKNPIILIFFLITSISFSQSQNNPDTTTTQETTIQELVIEPYNPLSQPNTYQNSDNPNYWKNKMPYEGYWQQDVHKS